MGIQMWGVTTVTWDNSVTLDSRLPWGKILDPASSRVEKKKGVEEMTQMSPTFLFHVKFELNCTVVSSHEDLVQVGNG